MFNLEIVELKLSDLKSTQSIDPKKKEKLKQKIYKEGFDYNKGYIFVSKQNEIINGNHRYHALCELKGLEEKIIVRKTNKSKKFYIYESNFTAITFLFLFFVMIKNLISDLYFSFII